MRLVEEVESFVDESGIVAQDGVNEAEGFVLRDSLAVPFFELLDLFHLPVCGFYHGCWGEFKVGRLQKRFC